MPNTAASPSRPTAGSRTRTICASFSSGVQNQDARELIYGTVLELAMADFVSGRESELLQWLGKTWQVETSFDSPEQ